MAAPTGDVELIDATTGYELGLEMLSGSGIATFTTSEPCDRPSRRLGVLLGRPQLRREQIVVRGPGRPGADGHREQPDRGGGHAEIFKVTLSFPVDTPLTFSCVTSDATAFAGTNYTAANNVTYTVPANAKQALVYVGTIQSAADRQPDVRSARRPQLVLWQHVRQRVGPGDDPADYREPRAVGSDGNIAVAQNQNPGGLVWLSGGGQSYLAPLDVKLVSPAAIGGSFALNYDSNRLQIYDQAGNLISPAARRRSRPGVYAGVRQGRGDERGRWRLVGRPKPVRIRHRARRDHEHQQDQQPGDGPVHRRDRDPAVLFEHERVDASREDETTIVDVGEMVSLKAVVKPASAVAFPIGYAWNVPGVAAADYNPEKPVDQSTWYQGGEYGNQASAGLFWADGAYRRKVDVSVFSGCGEFVAGSLFTVVRPDEFATHQFSTGGEDGVTTTLNPNSSVGTVAVTLGQVDHPPPDFAKTVVTKGVVFAADPPVATGFRFAWSRLRRCQRP